MTPTKRNILEIFGDYFAHDGLNPESTSRELYRAIKNQKVSVDATMDLANKLLSGHGIEAVRGDYHVDNYYYDTVALYVNMGDTYAATLLFETDTGRFKLTTLGDWVEKNQRRYRII
jgi:hypothetical protein